MSDETISPENHYLDGVVLLSDYVYLATQLDDLDPNETWHTRMVVFDEQADDVWSSRDIECNIVSICEKLKTSKMPGMVCALSKEGDVELVSLGVDLDVEKPVLEKIPDAGLRLGDNGYTTCIREIAGTLYVCGQNGQFYRRGSRGWEHMDEGLFTGSLREQPALKPGEAIDRCHLQSLDGTSASDIYTVGMGGRIFHFDGESWRRLESPTKNFLQQVRCYGSDEVWICGDRRTLLRGNARDGFKVVMEGKPQWPTWWSMAKFQDHLYLANSDGLFRMSMDGHLELVKSGLKPEISTYKLDAIDGPDGALWSFGAKDLTRFDGKKWERFQDPDNEPIK